MQWPPTSPGWKRRKFHFVSARPRARRRRRQAELGEDLGDLVHEGDVDVALGVLDHLGRLGGLDRAAPEGAAVGHPAVDLRAALGHRVVLAGDHLHDPVDAMLAVAGIRPARANSRGRNVGPATRPRDALDQRPANVLGDAGIDGAFIDDRWSAGRCRSGRRRSRSRRSSGARSGRLAPSTGVGTVTM